LIFKESIRINGKDADDDNLSGDSTVQEKNVTYPTDDKLYKKIIVKCRHIAIKEALELRQSYKFTVKKLSTIQRFKKNKGGTVKARKAGKKIKTITGRLVRKLEHKLNPDSLNLYATDLSLFKTVLTQKK
jgi:transposase, IS5 family